MIENADTSFAEAQSGYGGSADAKLRCKVYLIPEAEGGYSVLAANLPGVGSQGDTAEEALANVVEAFEGCLESYRAHGEAIPWSADERPEGATTAAWVLVHA